MPESDLIQLKCWGSAHELVAIQVASVAASHAKANPGVPTDNLEIIVQTDLAQIFNDWSQGRSAIKLNQIIAQAEVRFGSAIISIIHFYKLIHSLVYNPLDSMKKSASIPPLLGAISSLAKSESNS